MGYNRIRKMDISDGPGVRVSIFMQGCHFHCKNCFNPETWDFDKGKEFTDTTIDRVLELAEKDYIAGLSILGGEPMHPKNEENTLKLAKAFKEKYPNDKFYLIIGEDSYKEFKTWTRYEDILKLATLCVANRCKGSEAGDGVWRTDVPALAVNMGNKFEDCSATNTRNKLIEELMDMYLTDKEWYNNVGGL